MLGPTLADVPVVRLGTVGSKPSVSLATDSEALSIGFVGVLRFGTVSMGSGMIDVSAGGSRVIRMAEGGQLLVDHSSDLVGGVKREVVVLVSCTLALR